MQEHPVPQNVTGYEFHLIGQMTLKQFMEIAIGIGIAFLINLFPIPVIFKYPLMFIVGISGIALAFVPLEGRSLDRWFFAFLGAIYKPTMFFWKKTNPVPEAFHYIQPRNLAPVETVDYRPIRSARVQEFLQTIQKASPEQVENDDAEPDISHIMDLFSQPLNAPLPSSPTPMTTSVLPPVKEVVQIPPTPPPIAPTSTPEPVAADAGTALPGAVLQQVSAQSKEVTINAADVKPVQMKTDLPFPKPPDKPNMIVGMVVDPQNKIIDNAIVEILRQGDETPVRAMKTNTLGQFGVVTPLESGQYYLCVEKDGHQFDKMSLVLNKEIVQPLLVQAKV